MVKTCTLCGVEKPLHSFSPEKLGRLGRKARCKPCNSAEVLRRHRTTAGKEIKRRANKAWYEKNRADILRRTAAQRAAYRKANPEIVRASYMRYRARKHAAELTDFTPAQWRMTLAEFDNRCAYCSSNGPLEQEHLTPISRGGSHTTVNVVPACAPCNRRKNARTMFEFLTISGGTSAWAS